MSIISQLRNFRTLWVMTTVVACFSNAFAQQNYKMTDLGVNKSSDNFNMVMGLNNQAGRRTWMGF